MLFIRRNFFLYLLFALCIFQINAKAPENSRNAGEINILFASDMNEISSVKKGGYASVAYMLKQQREKTTPLFFFFGGGSIGPSLLSSFDRGSHIIDILNAIEPDVMSISKRDFSFFEDELSLRSYEAAFPFIASNIIETETKQPLDGLFKSVVTQQGNYTIGVLSTLSDNAITEYNLKRITITDKKKAIITEAKKLRDKNVDLIVLINSSRNNDVFPLLMDNTVDFIFQKDSLALTSNRIIPQHPRHIFIREEDQFALINISGIDKKNQDLIKVDTQFYSYTDLDKESNMQKLVERYQERLSTLLEEVIGITRTPINTQRTLVRSKENNFANFVADALKEYTEADIGIVNGGSIRGENVYVKNQNITRRHIISELPYRNRILVLQISGIQIREAIENGLTGIDKALGKFLQVSGLQVTYDRQLPINERVISIKHNGEKLVNNKIYKVAMSDYLASGGDDFTMWQGAQNFVYRNPNDMLISDIVINYIRKKGEIAPKTENRLIDLTEPKN